MLKLSGKKIAILGFGKEGQATFDYLTKNGIPIAAVLDNNPQLKPDTESKISHAGVKFIGGNTYLDGLNEYDLLFRSPGIPRMHPKLTEFKNPEAIFSHSKLFFELCPCPIVAVTGTKGKTTTTSLVYEILKASGKNVFLGGNIGEPPLNFLDQLTLKSVVALEVSSFQAQDLHKSPHVGVILNVTHDHLDDGTFRAASHINNEEYLQAKAQLIANQSENDIAILHPGLGGIFLKSGQGRKITIQPDQYKNWDRKLVGEHNLENIGAAALACTELGIPEDVIKKTVANFSGVPMRLQPVGERNGIKYVNDSAGSNPESTIAAIKSFNSNIILIVGGSEKGFDYGELGQIIVRTPYIKALIVIGQVATQILAAVTGFKGSILTAATTMDEIITQANSVATTGDTIVLSPGAASFDMFENYKDRGEQFDRAVNAL
jgi:UDP-N-acetylmuramoylalanine--D-glutamate ligase